MEISLNRKYRLSKKYLDSLIVKPKTDLIEIQMVYNNMAVYTDGISQFTESVVNLYPNLSKPDVGFSMKNYKKTEVSVAQPIEPSIPTEPVQPTEPEPIVPTEPDPTIPTEPDPFNNPFDNPFSNGDYI